ncbi:3-oxoacyl-[acyl-carrier-protein] reductase FabG [Brevibacterium casei]|uniref:3-oxoacyl-[acyl-carrier-protein] reductase FabG n=1 Tax=Brevibacterium casei TaxID=33889 RepID=A0A449D9I5_9MICO|nr:SDR family oxidoreductase [Brevibacterium casei]VEW14215.1 3-oxoacyl-[acyl-carrier-protein] reductase FabG [Brevibacterium casei]
MTATRTALVTGASRGIGQATAQRLASLGFDVIAQHRGDDSELNPIREVAAEHQTTVTPVQADFSDPGAVEALLPCLDAALDGRTVDVAFLNAGIAPFGDFTQLTESALRDLFQVNTIAPYALAAGLAEKMTSPGGQVIFTGSALTRYAFPALTGYGMSKIALEYLTRNMAAGLGSRGITVNVVAPGVVDTDINAGWLRGNDEAAAGTRESSALGKIAEADDIAEIVALLAQSTSQAITGQVIDTSMGTSL